MSVPPLLRRAAPPSGVCNLDPSVPGKSPRYPPDATLSPPPSDSYSGYHSQFDHHIRADRRNFKSANECGRGQADRNPEAGVGSGEVSLPGNRGTVRPGFGNDCNDHVMTFFPDGCGELGVFVRPNVF